MTEAYPLQWPTHHQRTHSDNRRRAQFGRTTHNGRYPTKKQLSVNDALTRLQDEIDRLGADDYVLSSNLRTRLDGLPRSGQAEPDDPGAALYFELDGKPHCLPCDTFDRVADNIAAIAKHIEATRAIERYGVATLAEMFTGFAALPPPIAAEAPWWHILGVDRGAAEPEIRAAYKAKVKAHQADGTLDSVLKNLNVARDAGIREKAQ